MPNTTLPQRIEFLSREMGISEAEVLAKAIEIGVCVLYKEKMGEKFLAGGASRENALEELGPKELARLECLMRQKECEELDIFCGHA